MQRRHRPHTDNGTDFYCKWCHVELGKMAEFNYRPLPNIPGNCPKAPPPWGTWRLNKSLLRNIKSVYGTKPFTNKGAYITYNEDNAIPNWERETLRLAKRKLEDPNCIFYIPPKPTWKDYCLQMNVRNTLCAAAYKGILIRLGPGHYKFPEA